MASPMGPAIVPPLLLLLLGLYIATPLPVTVKCCLHGDAYAVMSIIDVHSCHAEKCNSFNYFYISI